MYQPGGRETACAYIRSSTQTVCAAVPRLPWLAALHAARMRDRRAPAWPAYYAAKAEGIPFLTTYHGIYNSNSWLKDQYNSIMTKGEHIIANSNNDLLRGIAMVVEAHAFGTAASLFGDIPYSEAGNSEIQDPAFDSQVQVYTQVIARLDEAISTLNSASSGSIPEDIYFGGDKAKWIAAANTLKARFYLHQKDYPSALSAAQKTFFDQGRGIEPAPGSGSIP